MLIEAPEAAADQAANLSRAYRVNLTMLADLREAEAAAPVWNGLRRLWMVDGVAVAPQPAAPVTGTVIESVGTRLLPSVKVSA